MAYEYVVYYFTIQPKIPWSEILLSQLQCLPFESFEKPPLPIDVQEYKLYKQNMTDFVSARNQRIVNDYNNVEL